MKIILSLILAMLCVGVGLVVAGVGFLLGAPVAMVVAGVAIIVAAWRLRAGLNTNG